jgi:hypothetical protein
VGDVGERYVGHALWHEKVDPVDQAMSFLAVSPVFARDYAELLFPGLTSQHLKGLTLGKFAVRERRGIRSALGSTKRTIYRNPIMPSYPVPQKLKSLGVFQRYWDPFLAPLALRLTFPPQGGVFLGSDFCYWAEQFMGDSAPWDWAPLGIGLGVAPVGDDGVELGVWVGRVRGVPKRAILAGVLREVSPVVMALRELGARVQLRWVWSYFARSHGFDLRPHSKLPTSFLSGVGYLRYADLEVSKGVQLVPEMQSHDLIHGASPLMPWTWECRHFDGNGQLLSRNPVSNLQLARI